MQTRSLVTPRAPRRSRLLSRVLLSLVLTGLLIPSPSVFALRHRPPESTRGIVQTIDRARRLFTIQRDPPAVPLVLHWTWWTNFFQDGERTQADALHENTRVEVSYLKPLFGNIDVYEVRWKVKPPAPRPSANLAIPTLPRLVSKSPGEIQINNARATWLDGQVMVSGSVERKFGYSYPDSSSNHIVMTIYDAQGKPLGHVRTDYIPKPLAASFRYGQTHGTYASYLPMVPPPGSTVKIICDRME